MIVLKGKGEILWAKDANDESPEIIPCGPGDFFFYPAFSYHTIRNPAANREPIEYLMYRWASVPVLDRAPTLERIRWASVFKNLTTEKGFHSELLFEGPTRHLKKLHAHLSWVKPGAGYPAHEDDYDVAILLMRGKVRTLGKIVEAPAVLFHPAGIPHGLEATGGESAHYLVFEFHGTPEQRPAPIGYLRGLVRNFLSRFRSLVRS